jgi:hypothetical protein
MAGPMSAPLEGRGWGRGDPPPDSQPPQAPRQGPVTQDFLVASLVAGLTGVVPLWKCFHSGGGVALLARGLHPLPRLLFLGRQQVALPAFAPAAPNEREPCGRADGHIRYLYGGVGMSRSGHRGALCGLPIVGDKLGG